MKKNRSSKINMTLSLATLAGIGLLTQIATAQAQGAEPSPTPSPSPSSSPVAELPPRKMKLPPQAARPIVGKKSPNSKSVGNAAGKSKSDEKPSQSTATPSTTTLQKDTLPVTQAAPATAQAVSATHLTEAAPATPAPKRFGLMLNVQASSNFLPAESADHAAELGFLFVPNVKLTDKLTLSARLGLTKDLENERDAKMENSKLTLGHKAFVLNPFLKIAPSIAATLPTNREARDGDSLRGAAHLQQRLDGSLEQIGVPQLSFYYQTVLTRNIHQYETAYSGKSNTRYSIGNTINLAWAFSDKFDLSAQFVRSTGWTYHNNPRNTFDLSQTFNYNATQALSIWVGHSNSGQAYKENGVDNNIAIFSPYDSTFYGGLTFVY